MKISASTWRRVTEAVRKAEGERGGSGSPPAAAVTVGSYHSWALVTGVLSGGLYPGQLTVPGAGGWTVGIDVKIKTPNGEALELGKRYLSTPGWDVSGSEPVFIAVPTCACDEAPCAACLDCPGPFPSGASVSFGDQNTGVTWGFNGALGVPEGYYFGSGNPDGNWGAVHCDCVHGWIFSGQVGTYNGSTITSPIHRYGVPGTTSVDGTLTHQYVLCFQCNPFCIHIRLVESNVTIKVWNPALLTIDCTGDCGDGSGSGGAGVLCGDQEAVSDTYTVDADGIAGGEDDCCESLGTLTLLERTAGCNWQCPVTIAGLCLEGSEVVNRMFYTADGTGSLQGTAGWYVQYVDLNGLLGEGGVMAEYYLDDVTFSGVGDNTFALVDGTGTPCTFPATIDVDGSS